MSGIPCIDGPHHWSCPNYTGKRTLWQRIVLWWYWAARTASDQ